jgi:hypothetical protein
MIRCFYHKAEISSSFYCGGTVSEGLAIDGTSFENVLHYSTRKRPFLKIINFRRVNKAVVKASLFMIFRPPISLLLCLQGTLQIRPDRLSWITRICDIYYSVSMLSNSGKHGSLCKFLLSRRKWSLYLRYSVFFLK